MKKKIPFFIFIQDVLLIIVIVILGLYIYSLKTGKSLFNLKKESDVKDIPSEVIYTGSLEPQEVKPVSYVVASMMDDVVINYPSLRSEIYDSLTYEEIVDKVNRNLKSDLSGYGSVFVDACLEYNVDIYMAVAISLHESGCSYKCSGLTSKCYNVAGIKGNPSCGNSGYLKYNSMEDGIKGFVRLLGVNYVGKGLTTPELIGPVYAGGSTTWAPAIRSYINKIQNS